MNYHELDLGQGGGVGGGGDQYPAVQGAHYPNLNQANYVVQS